MLKGAAAAISVGFLLAGYYFYLRDSFAGRTKPHPYHWLVSTFLSAIVFALLFKSGAGLASIPVFLTIFTSFALFLIAIKTRATPITRIDTVCFVLAIVSIAAWLVADNPAAAIVLVTAADVLAFMPTVRKSFHRPYEESMALYVLCTFRFVFGVVALSTFSFVTVFELIVWIFGNGLFALFLWFRRRSTEMHARAYRGRIVIREFGGDQSEMKEIADLHLSIRRWQEANGQNSFSNINESQNDLLNIDSYYIQPGGTFLVARETNGEVAGFVGLRPIGAGDLQLKRMAVVPRFQQNGIGTRLCCEAIEWAKQNSVSRVTLLTNVGEHAKAIYEASGFTVTGFVAKSQDYQMTLSLVATDGHHPLVSEAG